MSAQEQPPQLGHRNRPENIGQKPPQKDIGKIVLMAGLMALSALGIDIMLPALGQMAHDIGLASVTQADQNKQQWIIFAFVLGFGLTQIFWGPVSDAYGRRGPLLISLTGYCLTAIACIFATKLWPLLILRFIQGLFASGARLMCGSIIRDMFAGRAMASFMSMVLTIFMIVPIVAPLLGQAILAIANWETIFWVLAAGSFGLFIWVFLGLKETLPVSARAPMRLKPVLASYGLVLSDRLTFGYMAASGVVFGSLFGYIYSAEQIFHRVFHQGENFGWWFASISIALASMNMANALLVERFGMRLISHTALIIFTVSSATLALFTLVFGDQIWVFGPSFAVIFACFGLMGSNFNALAMEAHGARAGTANAVYGFASTTISSLLGALIGSFFNGTTIPLLTGFVCLGVASFVIIWWAEKGVLFHRHA